MKLSAVKREVTGSSSARAARAEDKLPCVIYKRGEESIPVLIDHKEMADLVRKKGRNAIFDVELDGGETLQVIIKEVSRAALKPEIYSVELQAIKAGQMLTVTVPIHLVGANDLTEGVLTQTLNELEVEATADNIPNDITFEINKDLAIGEHIAVSDLVIPEGVTVLDDAETAVAVVSAPVEEEELPEDGTEVPAEAEEPKLVSEDEE